MGSGLALGLALSLVAPAPAAWAQAPSSSARAMAEALFREGRRLLAAGQVAEACRKFEASYAAESVPGTLLNMALCHEREGKTATAWAELKQSLAMAKAAGRVDRERIAEERLAAIEPRLARLVLTVEGATTPGLYVSLDGVRIAPGAFGTPIPVDPGEHELSAAAPGRISWTAKVTVVEAASVASTVPELAMELAASTAPPSAPPSAPATDWKKPVGWVGLGVGAVAIGAGSYFGVRAIQRVKDRDVHCKGDLCNREGLELDSDARAAATTANILLGAGIATAATGLVLLILAAPEDAAPPSGASSARRVRVWATPAVGPGLALGTVGGSF